MSPEFPGVVYTPKYKWPFKKSAQPLYAKFKSGIRKLQSTNDIEFDISAVSSCTSGTQKFIQEKYIHTCVE